MGPKTINEEVAILGKILGYDEEIGELRQAPPKMRRLEVPRPSFDFLDFGEADRLVAAARHAPEPWCAMIPTALWTGLRLGELRALRWEDLELDGARLHVRHAADDVNELHPPKSGQPRVVDLPRVGWHMLRHTYASHLMMCGAEVLEVRDLLGHASLEMTMRYAHCRRPLGGRRSRLDETKPRQYSGNVDGPDT